MISVCVLYGTIRYGTVRKLWLDLTLYVLYLDVGIVSLAFDSADIEILRFDLSCFDQVINTHHPTQQILFIIVHIGSTTTTYHPRQPSSSTPSSLHLAKPVSNCRYLDGTVIDSATRPYRHCFFTLLQPIQPFLPPVQLMGRPPATLRHSHPLGRPRIHREGPDPRLHVHHRDNSGNGLYRRMHQILRPTVR